MQINIERFYKYLDGFKTYIETMSNTYMNDLSSNDFFLNQEGYKHDVYKNAQKILDFQNWGSSDVGTGKIAKRVIQAVDEGANLIHHQQKLHFKNKVTENFKSAEKVLYNIYCGNDDAASFEEAVKFFGGKYDLLGYLFFIKDDKKYLPINSSNFDERFNLFGIPFKTYRNCSSKNYFSFINYIEEMRKIMEKYYGFDITLLDAHSVIWQISLANKFVAQMEEKNADAVLMQEVNDLLPKAKSKSKVYDGKPKEKVEPIYSNGHKIFPRNRFTALNALHIAGNCCELNPEHESFVRKNSDLKYMEPHHLVPMAYSEEFAVSLDVEANIVCLCSNCHNEIHYGKKSKELVKELYEKRKDLLKSVEIDITLDDLLAKY